MVFGELANLEALEKRERLMWAFRFRRRLIIGLLAVYTLAVVTGLVTALWAVLAFFLFFLGVNEVREWLFWHERIDERSSPPTVLLETVAVGAIIYFSGGVESPLIALSVLQVVGISTFVGYDLAWVSAYFSTSIFTLVNLSELTGMIPHSPLFLRTAAGGFVTFRHTSLGAGTTWNAFAYLAVACTAYGVMLSLAAYSSGYINSKMKVREELLARANRVQASLSKLSATLLGELSLDRAVEILTDWLHADLGYRRVMVELEPPGQPKLARQTPEGAVPEEELARLLTMRPDAEEPAYFVGWLHLPVAAGGKTVGWLMVEMTAEPPPEERAVLETALNQFRTCLEKVTYHQDVLALSITDGMTGIHNRRHFAGALKGEVLRARRFSTPLALLLVDVDHFKRVNDQRGHLAGDAILKGLAARLKDAVRTIDLVARYGGEEFVVVAPQTDLKSAATFGERLRKRIAEEVFTYAGEQLPVTVSIGVSELLGDTLETEEDLIRIADERLYKAKEGGRNRVVAN